MRGIAAIALIALAGIAGWYGRGYYEANRYVDGPCFVSGVRSRRMSPSARSACLDLSRQVDFAPPSAQEPP